MPCLVDVPFSPVVDVARNWFSTTHLSRTVTVKLRGDMGYVLIVVGFVLGVLVYLVTAGVFFAQGNEGLGLIQLLVPPAELVLPWVVSARLGGLSLLSLCLILVGAWMQSRREGE